MWVSICKKRQKDKNMTITKYHIVNGKSQEGSVYVHKSLEIDLFHLIDFGCSK